MPLHRSLHSALYPIRWGSIIHAPISTLYRREFAEFYEGYTGKYDENSNPFLIFVSLTFS